MARIGPAEVRARYGVDPERVPDFIALRGDPSDKVPGARRRCDRAANLLQRYGSLEAALAAGRFSAMAGSLRLYRSIATMKTSKLHFQPSQSDANLAQGRRTTPANGS